MTSFDYSKKESKIKLTPHAVVSGGSHFVMLIGVVIPDVSVPPLKHDETAFVCDTKEPLLKN